MAKEILTLDKESLIEKIQESGGERCQKIVSWLKSLPANITIPDIIAELAGEGRPKKMRDKIFPIVLKSKNPQWLYMWGLHIGDRKQILSAMCDVRLGSIAA